MKTQPIEIPNSTSIPCEVCEECRPDQPHMTSNGRAVYVALVCDQCQAMVEEVDRMQGISRARVYRLITGTRRTGAV